MNLTLFIHYCQALEKKQITIVDEDEDEEELVESDEEDKKKWKNKYTDRG